MRKRTLVILVAGVAVVAALTWNSTRVRPVAVTVVAVERGEVRASVSNTRAGTVDACHRARMAPTMGGQIAALPVDEGDTVETGQVLLELWNDDVRAQLLLAEKERNAAEARAEEACATADVARREAARITQLFEKGLSSEETADSTEGDSISRQAACRASLASVEVADAKVALAKAQLERTIIRAPFAGTVAEINGEIGEVVTPSPVGVPTLPAVDLVDTSCLYVTAPIDEMDAPAIRAGMRASISLDAFPQGEFPATVRRVAPYVLDVEKQARTVDIEAEFDEPSDNLLPGYSADVEIILNQRFNVLRIPTQALLPGSRVLVIDDDGILREKTIRTGIGNWQVTEVVDGLVEGEQIVLSVERADVVAGNAAVAERD